MHVCMYRLCQNLMLAKRKNKKDRIARDIFPLLIKAEGTLKLKISLHERI